MGFSEKVAVGLIEKVGPSEKVVRVKMSPIGCCTAHKSFCLIYDHKIDVVVQLLRVESVL